MIRFITHRPWMTLALILCASCVIFGPATTGSWIGVHGRWAIVAAYRFLCALVNGAF